MIRAENAHIFVPLFLVAFSLALVCCYMIVMVFIEGSIECRVDFIIPLMCSWRFWLSFCCGWWFASHLCLLKWLLIKLNYLIFQDGWLVSWDGWVSELFVVRSSSDCNLFYVSIFSVENGWWDECKNVFIWRKLGNWRIIIHVISSKSKLIQIIIRKMDYL